MSRKLTLFIHKNITLKLIALLILFFVYNDYTQVEHEHAFFTYYDNMSHFSMYVALRNIWTHALILSNCFLSVVLFVLSLLGIKPHLEIFLNGIKLLIIKLKFMSQIVACLVRKTYFEISHHFSKLFLFLQTKEAILPYI